MTLSDFIAKYNGKGIDFDGWFGDQCVDLMNQYLVDVLGITSPVQVLGGDTAFHIYENATDSRFTKTDNSPTGVPVAGDIVFWNTTIGAAGHVAVFISGDANSFTSFDQNWPTGSLCHEQAHDYKGVAGWLHFNQNDTQAIIDELRTARDLNHNLYMEEVAKNNDLTKELQDTQKTLQELREAFDKQTTADASLGTQLLDVSHERDQLKGDFDAVAGALKVSPVLKDVLAAILVLQQPVEEQVKPLQKHALSLQEALDAFITNKPYKSLIDRIKKFLNI